MDALEALEAWKRGHKSREVVVSHDNGYGASAGWDVELQSGDKLARVLECSISQPDEGEWAGLAATILAALKRAEEMGL